VPASSAPAAGEASARQPLLVVDDNAMNREILARNVKRQGYEAVTAEDGYRALELLEHQRFDLVLLDVMMPGMDGVEVLQRLKQAPAWRDIPVIMISAMDEIETVVRCIEMGADDYLHKPFNPVLLAARITACLEKKRLRDQEQLWARSMERELEIGREIQASFFPDALPQPAGWEIAAEFEAARQVSGDFYDGFPLADGTAVGFVIADVCDKGVGAALFMGLFRSFVRAFSEMHDTAERDFAATLRAVVGQTNDYIATTHGDSNMFAAMFLGVLDTIDARIHYINGGLEAPVLVGRDGVRQRLEPTGPAVGLLPEMPFDVRQLTLDPGEALVLFTDGLTEARDPRGQLFGEQRLLAGLQAGTGSASETAASLMRSLHDYTAGGDPVDDITLMVIKRQL